MIKASMLIPTNKQPRSLFKVFKVSFFVLTTLTLIGCGSKGSQDLHDYVTSIKAREKGIIEPLPEIKTFETFIFNGEALRDPFAPAENVPKTADIATGNGVLPNANRRKEELESFSLDSLRMVGTLQLRGSLWALVKSGDGTIHRLLPGNYMGENHGKINRILVDRIELTEIVSDSSGTWLERQAALALSE